MWPTYWTIEKELSDKDSYKWKYGRLSCRVWLTTRGMFYGQIDRWPVINGWDYREVLDKMFNAINKNTKG